MREEQRGGVHGDVERGGAHGADDGARHTQPIALEVGGNQKVEGGIHVEERKESLGTAAAGRQVRTTSAGCKLRPALPKKEEGVRSKNICNAMKRGGIPAM